MSREGEDVLTFSTEVLRTLGDPAYCTNRRNCGATPQAPLPASMAGFTKTKESFPTTTTSTTTTTAATTSSTTTTLPSSAQISKWRGRRIHPASGPSSQLPYLEQQQQQLAPGKQALVLTATEMSHAEMTSEAVRNFARSVEPERGQARRGGGGGEGRRSRR
ncbi:unnamed protein product [Arctogadus glacialis]